MIPTSNFDANPFSNSDVYKIYNIRGQTDGSTDRWTDIPKLGAPTYRTDPKKVHGIKGTLLAV